MEKILLIEKLKDLQKQAITEYSHYYTANLLDETIKFLENISNRLEPQVKPANGVNKYQKFYLGEEVLLTIPMEKALEDVAEERLSSKGIIKMIWLKLGETVIYKVKLEREVLGEKIIQTDGKILSRLSV